MKILQMALAAFVVASLATAGAGEEKKTDVKKLLVGKWEVTKADAETISVGSVVEFAADGKVKVREKDGDSMLEGSYTIDGATFTVAIKVGDQELKKKITVNKLTETELDTMDENKKSAVFKRVK